MEILEGKVYSDIGNMDVVRLVENANNIILDVGCGSGDNARLLAAGKNNIVDGITISENELKNAEKILRRGYLYNLENGLPPEIADNTYDYIICSHVLEHIAYPQKLLKDIYRVLKTNGYFIVALPNVFYYRSRIELIKGNFKQESTGIWDNTHLRWYSYKSGMDLLTSHGFKMDKAAVTGLMPFSSIFKHVLPKAVRDKIYKGLTRISRGFFGGQLLYRAKKAA